MRLAAAASVLAACAYVAFAVSACHEAARDLSAPSTTPRRLECLSGPPPVPPDVQFSTCKFGNWGACLDPDDLLDLTVYLDEVRRWSRNAWVYCR